MANVNDVVTLPEGSTGVVGEALPSHGSQQYRVYFFDSYLDVTDADIASTLSAPTYSVNDEVTVWPFSGTITAIDGDTFTVSIDRSKELTSGGIFTWTADYKAPRWRIIKDNDSRIERDWT